MASACPTSRNRTRNRASPAAPGPSSPAHVELASHREGLATPGGATIPAVAIAAAQNAAPRTQRRGALSHRAHVP